MVTRRRNRTRPAFSLGDLSWTMYFSIIFFNIPFSSAQHQLKNERIEVKLRNRGAVPEPAPQGNVYQSSGAVYILPGNGGQQFSGAAPAICPDNAPQGCGSINVWNWCCYSGTSCYKLDNGNVGCCSGNYTCPGSAYVAPAGTVTVTNYNTQTVTQATNGTTYVVGGGVVTQNQIVTAPTSTITTTTTTKTTSPSVIAGGQYCSTITAKGGGLPKTASGDCGTILIVNSASRNGVDSFLFWLLVWLFKELRIFF